MNKESNISNSKSLWIGLVVLAIGVALLLNGLNLVFFPWWLFRWPMILIILGLIVGIKKNFNDAGWLILVSVGLIFLLDDLGIFMWNWRFGPAIIVIIIGSGLIFRALFRRSPALGTREYQKETSTDSSVWQSPGEPFAASGEDYIDIVNVFGGTNRRIFSKHFKGGESTNFFGGTTLDLTQADVEGTAVVDIVMVFGGIKLIVPSDWQIETRMTTIMGGTEDKRSTVTAMSPNKRLVLTGICIFGGVEIRSF